MWSFVTFKSQPLDVSPPAKMDFKCAGMKRGGLLGAWKTGAEESLTSVTLPGWFLFLFLKPSGFLHFTF